MLLEVFFRVFKSPVYFAIAVLVAISAFVLTLWIPHYELIVSSFFSSSVLFVEKIKLPITLLGSLLTSFTLFSGLKLIFVSILFGIDVALLAFYFKRKIEGVKIAGLSSGFLGMASSVLGSGCAACGTLLFPSAFSFLGLSTGFFLSPLYNIAFGLLPFFFLLISIYLILKMISRMGICKV